jgi:hypothetical protein
LGLGAEYKALSADNINRLVIRVGGAADYVRIVDAVVNALTNDT